MWFQNFGHMKTIQIKISTIKRLLVIGILIALILIISLLLNIYLSGKNLKLKSDIKALERGLKNTESICAKTQTGTSSETDESGRPYSTQSDESAMVPEPIEEEVEVSPVTDSPIEISNVRKIINFKSNKVTISFQLRHLKTEDRRAISGYVVLAAKNEDIAEPVYATYPSGVSLNNGFPSDYRLGDPFNIRNLKNVTGSLPVTVKNIKIRDITILVFSSVGELLLEKTISLEEDKNV